MVKNTVQDGAYLRAAGQEGLDVDVGVMHFEVVVAKASRHPDGRQHTSLHQIRGVSCTM